MIQETRPFATLATWLSSPSFRISKHFWCTSLLLTTQFDPIIAQILFSWCSSISLLSESSTSVNPGSRWTGRTQDVGQVSGGCFRGSDRRFILLWFWLTGNLNTIQSALTPHDGWWIMQSLHLDELPEIDFSGSDIGARWEVSKPTAALWKLYSNCSHGSTDASVLMAGNAISHK